MISSDDGHVNAMPEDGLGTELALVLMQAWAQTAAYWRDRHARTEYQREVANNSAYEVLDDGRESAVERAF